MTDISSSRLTKQISESNSREFGSNIPANAPDWAKALAQYNHQRFDKIEGSLESMSELVGRVMGFTMQTKQIGEGVKELAEVTAARVQAFMSSQDKSDDITKKDIDILRKQMRTLRRDGVFDRSSHPDGITTDQRNAITAAEAGKIAHEADERREREREVRELKEEIQVMKAASLVKEAAAEKTRDRLLDKILIPIMTGIVLIVVSVYATWRMTRPAVQFEMKEAPHNAK
jgi:Fe2+ transport system protein B